MIEIGIAQESDFSQIDELYVAAGYGGGVSENDKVMVARLGDHVVGVVRLRPEEGVTVLRGMQIVYDLQRKGIGAGMLRHVLVTWMRLQRIAYLTHISPSFTGRRHLKRSVQQSSRDFSPLVFPHICRVARTLSPCAGKYPNNHSSRRPRRS
ncbi:GNAT family N-acetyltransferase [Duganella sp. Root1480D1]|uniref:GNAT family N-acetyltransferase n=1 Tax=Duganella sp. Root1480D1 TaxID=1736471 RepID=UPI0035A5DBBA